jgi:transposase-like protein
VRVLPESEFMSMTASRRRFSQEFKDELCQEVISTSKTIKDVAVAYGVGPETLRTWLIKYRDTHGGACPGRVSMSGPGSRSWSGSFRICGRRRRS